MGAADWVVVADMAAERGRVAGAASWVADGCSSPNSCNQAQCFARMRSTPRCLSMSSSPRSDLNMMLAEAQMVEAPMVGAVGRVAAGVEAMEVVTEAVVAATTAAETVAVEKVGVFVVAVRAVMLVGGVQVVVGKAVARGEEQAGGEGDIAVAVAEAVMAVVDRAAAAVEAAMAATMVVVAEEPMAAVGWGAYGCSSPCRHSQGRRSVRMRFWDGRSSISRPVRRKD